MSGAAATSQYEITLNGEVRRTESNTVWDLLGELTLQGRPIAVELNRAIVERESYPTTPVGPGDAIEIIQFVGGG